MAQLINNFQIALRESGNDLKKFIEWGRDMKHWIIIF